MVAEETPKIRKRRAAGLGPEKRTFRQRLERLLAAPLPEEEPEAGDTGDAVSAALIRKALSGDNSAFTTIRDTVGEKPSDKAQAGAPNVDMLEKGRERARLRLRGGASL